jgi:hypothetical protein
MSAFLTRLFELISKRMDAMEKNAGAGQDSAAEGTTGAEKAPAAE